MSRLASRWWKTVYTHRVALKRWLTVAFAVLVLALLGVAVTKVDWPAVFRALAQLPASSLWRAAGFALGAYAVYSCLDLIGRRYTRHGLTPWRSVLVGFISYAFTMSVGSTIGGMGLRMRLYAKQGLAQSVILRVWATSVISNWSGYLLVLGAVLMTGHIALPPSWDLARPVLWVLGTVCIGIVITYLVACVSWRRREWKIRNQVIELPQIRLAVIQVLLGVGAWLLFASVPYVLFQQRVPYADVLGIVLISAVAGLVARVPGGVGVMEYVFLTMLASMLPRHEILAVLLVFRLLYYIAPLMIAGMLYLAVEAGMKTSRRDLA